MCIADDRPNTPIIRETLHGRFQCLICVSHLDEYRLSLRTHAIRVVAPGKLPERYFQCAVVGGGLDSEHLIVVWFNGSGGIVEGVYKVGYDDSEICKAVVSYEFGRSGRRSSSSKEAGICRVHKREELASSHVGKVIPSRVFEES